MVGNFTSGGTESILMAAKTARDYFRVKKPEIKRPEMIIPETAHAAFHKAGQYFDIRLIQTPVDPVTQKADPEAMGRAVTPETILLVASAPSYAHGVIDPVAAIGELAREKDVLLHVDACVGGFLLPYFRRLGADVPDFDFSVPGVTSISLDLHKYAYAAKGASLIMYRNKDLRKHQIFSCASWPGYTMVNNTAQSSKSGGPMAAAWAVLHYIGDEGYLEIARRKLEATEKIAAGIEAIDGLRLTARPDICMISFTSDDINLFLVIDLMKDLGWYIQPQFAYGSSPANVHVSINASNLPWIDEFLRDLATCAYQARGVPFGQLGEAVVKEFEGKNAADIDDETLSQMLALAGLGGGVTLPEKMAEINEILNALPPAFRERLLTLFVNDLFIYRE